MISRNFWKMEEEIFEIAGLAQQPESTHESGIRPDVF